MSRQSDRVKAALMLTLATAFWSFSFATMRTLSLAQSEALPGASTWFISSLCAGLRFGLAALVLLLWSAGTWRRMSRLDLWQGLGLGAFGVGGIILQMDGLAYTSASTSAFLTQCYCLFLPVWLAVRERRWPSPLVVCCCLMVMTGVAILSKVNWRELKLGRGELETVLASVFFTGQILWLQRPAFARTHVSHFSAVMFVVMSLSAFALAAGSRHEPADWHRAYASGSSWVLMGILVSLCTLGGYLLMNRWQPVIGATEAGLIYCAEPVFVCLTAVFLPGWLGRLAGVAYPNESLDRSLLIGGGLITMANVLLQAVPLFRGRSSLSAVAAEPQ